MRGRLGSALGRHHPRLRPGVSTRRGIDPDRQPGAAGRPGRRRRAAAGRRAAVARGDRACGGRDRGRSGGRRRRSRAGASRPSRPARPRRRRPGRHPRPGRLPHACRLRWRPRQRVRSSRPGRRLRADPRRRRRHRGQRDGHPGRRRRRIAAGDARPPPGLDGRAGHDHGGGEVGLRPRPRHRAGDARRGSRPACDRDRARPSGRARGRARVRRRRRRLPRLRAVEVLPAAADAPRPPTSSWSGARSPPSRPSAT